MNLTRFENNDGAVLVVDSRLIADELDIQHSNFLATIKKYEPELLTFGQLLFQTETVTNSTGGCPEVFCHF